MGGHLAEFEDLAGVPGLEFFVSVGRGFGGIVQRITQTSDFRGLLIPVLEKQTRIVSYGDYDWDASNRETPGRALGIEAVIDHVLADRPGDWQVLIVGSQASDQSAVLP